jgi:hypothetical protein
MAFRRQDIPKTTRKPEEGGPRRIYPRFLRDRTILPKVDLAVDYLDGMVGRRRGDLSPDMLLELFGDPKLARCLLACMGEHYVYRTPEITNLIGEDAATALLKWDIGTPAELRGYLYLAANATRNGFVSDEDRQAFFAETGEVLGLSAAQVEELIHLDAERNALLIRIGPRPRAEDVVARYNVMLTLSVLRHASAIALDLPSLPIATVSAVCARHDVPVFTLESGLVRLSGRRSAVGTWSGFGARLARCAFHLLLLSPKTPSGEARVHFGDQTYRFVIDAKCTSAIRLKLRSAADVDGIAVATTLADDLTLHRRESDDLSGWRVRRWPEPVVVDGALLLPELAFTYGHVTVGALPVPAGRDGAGTLATLKEVNQARPVIALGLAGRLNGVPSVPAYDPEDVGALLAEFAEAAGSPPSALDTVEDQLSASGWLSIDRLTTLLAGRNDVESAVAPLTARDAVFVPGFGLCRTSVLADIRAEMSAGPIDIAALRRLLAFRVGDMPGTDALTLYLLTNGCVVSAIESTDNLAAA